MSVTITPVPRPLPELESELLGLAGHLAAAQCRFLRVLAEFDERAGWAGPGLKSCAHWLSWRIGMSLRTAHEHVRVAHALRRLPKVDEAFAAGRLSYSKVRAITRLCGRDPEPADPAEDTARTPGPDREGVPVDADPGATEPAPIDPGGADGRAEDTGAPRVHIVPPRPHDDAEETLLELALSGTASHVEHVVRAARRQQTDPARLAARRAVSWRWAEDGSLVRPPASDRPRGRH